MKATTTRKVKRAASAAAKTNRAIHREVRHARGLVAELQRLGNMTRDAAADSLDQAMKHVSDLHKRVNMEKLKDVQEDFGRYVKKHPLPILCLAVGSGFLAGWLRKK